jgi:hypothetical protein
MTMSTTMRNASLPPDAARLPPDERAAMEKSLQVRSGKTDVRTFKTSVTREDLVSGQGFMIDEDGDGKCTVKVITSTRTKLEQERTCSSPPSKTKAVFEVPDAEHMFGVIDTIRQGSKGPGSVHVEVTWRWVSASCKGFDD